MGVTKSVAGHGPGGLHSERHRENYEVNIAKEVQDLLPSAVKANAAPVNASRDERERLRVTVCPDCRGPKTKLARRCRKCYGKMRYRAKRHIDKKVNFKPQTEGSPGLTVQMGRHARGGHERPQPERGMQSPRVRVPTAQPPLPKHCPPTAHKFVSGKCYKCDLTLVDFARMQPRFGTRETG